jgi:hypothetical protein
MTTKFMDNSYKKVLLNMVFVKYFIRGLYDFFDTFKLLLFFFNYKEIRHLRDSMILNKNINVFLLSWTCPKLNKGVYKIVWCIVIGEYFILLIFFGNNDMYIKHSHLKNQEKEERTRMKQYNIMNTSKGHREIFN